MTAIFNGTLTKEQPLCEENVVTTELESPNYALVPMEDTSKLGSSNVDTVPPPVGDGQRQDILADLASALLELGQTSEPVAHLEESELVSTAQLFDLDNQQILHSMQSFPRTSSPAICYQSVSLPRHYFDPSQEHAAYPNVLSYPPNVDGTIRWQLETPAGVVPFAYNNGSYMGQLIPHANFAWGSNEAMVIKKELENSEEILLQSPDGCSFNLHSQSAVSIDSALHTPSSSVLSSDSEESFYKFPATPETASSVSSQDAITPHPHHSHVNLTDLSKKYHNQRFPLKLWNLTTDADFPHITWSEDGKGLIIDEYQLDSALKYFFRSGKFASFLRQLHLYGFRKMTRKAVKSSHQRTPAEMINEYAAKNFERDRFDLAKKLRRSYSSSPKASLESITPMDESLGQSTPPTTPSASYGSIEPTPPPSPPLVYHPLTIDHSYYSTSESSLPSSENSSVEEQHHLLPSQTYMFFSEGSQFTLYQE